MPFDDVVSRVKEMAGARPVFIWGAGRAGVTAVRYLRDHGVEPEGFVDSMASGDRRLEGLVVHPPSHLQSLSGTGRAPFVAVASMFAAEIVRAAEALGLSSPADLCVLQTPPGEFPGVADPLAPDFYALLHELRGHALADMPAGARTVLSAGCSGRWYFDWIEDKYGHVGRHIGVESFLARPDDLPANVEWLARDIAAVPEVSDGEVDLVFSGQNIEHLWPTQVAGFLLEAHRVLADGGWLVLDSPNREMTSALAWTHAEHTVEYSVSDVRELLDAAGFGDLTIRGIWLCRDRGRVLPVSPFDAGRPDSMEVLRRAALARARPEDSFVWWAEARKRRAPRRGDLARALDRMFDAAWPERLNRFTVPGPICRDEEGRKALLAPGEHGIVVEGPLFPLRKGRYGIGFRFRGRAGAPPCRVRLELTRGLGDRETPLASVSAEAGPEGAAIQAPLALNGTTFGLRARVFNDGGGPGDVLLDCRCAGSPEQASE